MSDYNKSSPGGTSRERKPTDQINLTEKYQALRAEKRKDREQLHRHRLDYLYYALAGAALAVAVMNPGELRTETVAAFSSIVGYGGRDIMDRRARNR